jgi:hypothetical protein
MWKRILTLFLADRIVRFLAGRSHHARSGHHMGGHFRHAYPRRWGHRNHGMYDLAEMMGLHRRRRSFI